MRFASTPLGLGKMFCPDCHSEIPVSADADVAVCQVCLKNSRRRRRVPKLYAENSSPSSKQPQMKYRVDDRHHGSDVPVQQPPIEFGAFVRSWMRARPLTHVAVFGLLVFLIGQSLHVWAFLVGNYFAWSAANLITVVGITMAIASLVVTLRNLESRISALAKKQSNANAARRRSKRRQSDKR